MQWDDTPHAGFTTAEKAWLAVNPNFREINARHALADRDSIYNYFRRMIALRKRTPALIYGDYKDLDPQNPNIFAYTRTLGADRYLVILNFSKEELAYFPPEGAHPGRLLISNLESSEENALPVNLKGWEARVYGS
jgi:oligo-1,6-glucosidase